MKLVTLLFLCAFLVSCKADISQRAPGALQKVAITNATNHQAVCLGGSPASSQICLLPEVVLPYITSSLMVKDSQHDNVILSKYGVFTPYDVQEQAYMDQYVTALKVSLSVQPYVFLDQSFGHILLATKGFIKRQVGQVLSRAIYRKHHRVNNL